MQQPLLDRSSFVQTAIIVLVTSVAAAMLGLVLAYWAWVIFAPSVEPRGTVSEPSGRATSAGSLFGTAQKDGIPQTMTGLAIKLLGVAATSRAQRGYAVLQLDGRESRVVAEGEEVSPGVRLAEIHPDHVVLERDGTRETLAWPAKAVVVSPQGARQ
jgi:general secretion pathway protein C